VVRRRHAIFLMPLEDILAGVAGRSERSRLNTARFGAALRR
jgi:hypothetical protein